MYQVLKIKQIVGYFLFIAAIVTIIMASINPPDDIRAAISLASSASSVTAVGIVLFGETPLFHVAWRQPFVQAVFFPYIHGEWAGELSSNWGVISTLREAASEGRKLDLNNLNVRDHGGFGKEVDVVIKASLFKISMKLIPKDAYSDSITIALKPVKDGDNGHPCLFYLYRTLVKNARPTDEQVHYGSARLDILRDNSNLILDGIYWTNRKWAEGMNTAGHLRVTKPA